MPRPPKKQQLSSGHAPAAPSASGEDEEEVNVFLNVYDILPSVNRLARCFASDWGIYHTGVQVSAHEFSYGGHPHPSTGVFRAKPCSARGAVFREQLAIGRSSLDPLELRQAIAEISSQWPGDTYDPFKRNCNHFSDTLLRELTGQSAPPYINRFTKSRVVRGIFYRCVVPIGRCLDRFYQHGGITYDDESDSGGDGAQAEPVVSGARGINQVLVEAATTQKLNANRLFKEGKFGEAQQCYNKAMGYLQTMPRRTEDDDEVVAQAGVVRRALMLNLALCALKEGEYAGVVETCGRVLSEEPSNQKALYRRGLALQHLGRLDDAAADLRLVLRAAEAEGDAQTARDATRELARGRQLADAERARDRDLAWRMLGGAGGAAMPEQCKVAQAAASPAQRDAAAAVPASLLDQTPPSSPDTAARAPLRGARAVVLARGCE